MDARLFIAACASAALLSAAGCSNNGTNTDRNANANGTAATTPNAAGTTGTADEANAKSQPITLSGCLQKGDHDDYILTEINEPNGGAVQNQNKVEREDLNAAEHAYRLKNENGKDSDLDGFVGRQVRVTGTLAKRSDIDQKVGTSGSNDKNQEVKLRDKDLAQVDVSGVQQTAASCGNHAAKHSARSKPRAK